MTDLPTHYLEQTGAQGAVFARAVVQGNRLFVYIGRSEEPILVCPLDDPDRDHNDEIDQLHASLGHPSLFVYHPSVDRYVWYPPQDVVPIDMASASMKVQLRGPRP